MYLVGTFTKQYIIATVLPIKQPQLNNNFTVNILTSATDKWYIHSYVVTA